MTIKQIKTSTGDSHEIKALGLPFGVCSTAAATAAKTVTVDVPFDTLEIGTTVVIKFTYANSATSPTLNVNSTGAKSIKRYGTTAVGTSTATTGWIDGAIQIFTYDGTNWIRDYWNNTTYSNVALGQGYCICPIAAATVEKTAGLPNYALSSGGIVSVKFTNGNTASNPTLNINNKGAIAIYYNGAALTDTSLIQAGDIVTMMYSGYYHILSISSWGSNKMDKTNPTGTGSLSLNRKADTTIGNYSVATGYNTEASGNYSHTEGYNTTASGHHSHAEGMDTVASGIRTHAEGMDTVASGIVSHVEGAKTIASGDYSHVQGLYNIEDTNNTYAHIVGNGSSEDARSNAHTLDWDGNAWFAGNVFIGGTSQEDADQLVDTVSNQNISGVKTFLNGISIGDEGVLIDYNASEKALQITFLQEIGEEEVETTTE